MGEKKNQVQPKKVLIGLLILLLVIAGVTGIGVIAKMTDHEVGNDSKLRKQLADASVTEITLSETVGVTSPMEVNGSKTIIGNGTLVAGEKFVGKEAGLLLLTDGADLTLKGSVTVDAKGADYGIYVEKKASLTLSEEAALTNAAQSNIYSLGQVTQNGGKVENGYDNVYIAKGGRFLWESGSNRSSVNHGIHVEEGAALKATSDEAQMREAGSHGIYLQGEAEIDNILLIKSGGNQIDVAPTGVLKFYDGDIAYSNSNGIANQGKMEMKGGSIYNSTYCGIVNTGEAELKAGSLLNNSDTGVLNRNGGKMTILSEKVNIGGNAFGVGNEEKGVCELAYATIRANTNNNIVNFGDIYIHDIKLEASGNNCINSNFGGSTVLKDVIIDGTGKNHGIFNANNALVEMDHVTIMNTAKRGIQNQNGKIRGSYITFENITTVAVGSSAHKRCGGGVITLDHVTTKNTGGSSLYLDGGGAGTVYISDSTFGATGSNNVSVKAGEAYLTDVEVQGHVKGTPSNAHGVYLNGGRLKMTDCKVSDTAGSAIRNNGGDVEITGLKVSNVTVHNVFASAGTTTLKNSTLDASDYHHIYSKGGTVIVDGCTLKKGVTSCLSVTSAGNVTVKNSTLEAASGNNVTVTGGVVRLENTSVQGNLPGSEGGVHGVYVTDGKLTLKNASISHTTGSAVRNNGGHITITGLSVKDIHVHNVFASAGTTDIKESILAASDYHHIYCKGGTVRLEKCMLEDGVVSSLSVPTGGVVTVLNSILGATSGNNVTVTGGTVNLENTKILGNLDASGDGTHGVYATGGKITLKNSSVSHTTGSAIRNDGGYVDACGLGVEDIGVHNVFASAGTTVLRNSTLEAAKNYHIYCRGGSVTAKDSILKEGAQGTISVPKGGTVTTVNCTLGAVSANNITVTGGTVNLENTKVLGNLSTCPAATHGVYLTSGNLYIKDSTITHTTGNAIRNRGADVKIDGLKVSDIGILQVGSHVITTVESSDGICGRVIINGLSLGKNCVTTDKRYVFYSESDGCYSEIGGSVLTAGKDNTLIWNKAGTIVLKDGIQLYGAGASVHNEGTTILKGLVKIDEIYNAQENVYVKLDGVLKTGSSVGLKVHEKIGTIAAKSDYAEDMKKNLDYLEVSEDLAAESLVLEIDSEHPERAILCIDTTPSDAARIGEQVYNSLQDAVNAAANVENHKVTIEVLKTNYLEDTVKIPAGYDITMKDDGVRTRRIVRSSTWTEAAPMFRVAEGGKLTLTSTGNDEESGSRLIVDGNGANVDSTANRLVNVPVNTIVNIGTGVRVCNFIQTIKGDDVGGVARVTGGTLNITGGVFEGNQAASGGVIATTVAGSVVNITGGKFINNKATVNHGGVFRIVVKSTLIADGAYFKGNTAAAEAGVLWLGNYASTVELKNCTFEANETGTWGGVISSHNTNTSASLLLENNRFSENISADTKSHGRDINLAGAVKAVTMKNNTFDNGGDHVVINNAGTEVKLSGKNTFEVYLNGANALKSSLAALKLTDTFDPGSRITLVSSSVPTIGNCVVICQSEAQATECLGSFSFADYGLEISGKNMVLNGNVASVGVNKYQTLQEAIDAAAESAQNVVILTDVTLKETVTIPADSNITITDDGVSIHKIMRHSSMGDVPMFDAASGGTTTTLTFSSTSSKAPMLVIDGSQSIVKSGGTTAARLAEIPAGVTVNVGSGVRICKHRISHIDAVGGVFNVKGGTLHITGGIFDGNEAASGGVIATNSASSKVEITGGTFTNNKATANHGGVFRLDTTTTLTVQNTIFEANKAASEGGVLRVQNKRVKIKIKNCVFQSNTANYGGVISYISSNADNKVLLEGNTFSGNIANNLGRDINISGKVTAFAMGNNTFDNNGNHMCIDNAGAEVILSGTNSFEVYLNTKAVLSNSTAALRIGDNFNVESRIILIAQGKAAPAVENIVVQCPEGSDANNYLNCFTLSGTKWGTLIKGAAGRNILLKTKI